MSSIPEAAKVPNEKLAGIVNQLLKSGYEDPENPLPPGPWGPVVAGAVLRTMAAIHPRPDPWRSFGDVPHAWRLAAARHPELWDLFGGGPLSLVALNPQPLPPGIVFATALAEEIVSRAAAVQEVIDALPDEGEQRGIIIVGGYVSRFVDDFCGNDFRMKFPFPIPPPRWFHEELGSADLIMLGTQFHSAARNTSHRELRRTLSDAGTRLVETALERM